MRLMDREGKGGGEPAFGVFMVLPIFHRGGFLRFRPAPGRINAEKFPLYRFVCR
jgi:hypothetical protein